MALIEVPYSHTELDPKPFSLRRSKKRSKFLYLYLYLLSVTAAFSRAPSPAGWRPMHRKFVHGVLQSRLYVPLQPPNFVGDVH